MQSIEKCLLCGHDTVVENKCKIRCTNCGFIRDCSDPYTINVLCL